MLILISTAESPSDAVVERWGGQDGGRQKVSWLLMQMELESGVYAHAVYTQTGCVVSSHQIEIDR